MIRHLEVRPGEYHDSVTLMLAGHAVAGVPGVGSALVAMATALNLELLADLGFAAPGSAGPNDLVVAFTCPDESVEGAALATLAGAVAAGAGSSGSPDSPGSSAGGSPVPARTTASALSRLSGNLALVSTPGLTAVAEAADALERGASVIVFSDNVPVGHEVRLKELARERGLLVMGPDCGTVVLRGAGFGFANVVRPGAVSLVAASGTGAQQVMALLDAAGVGVRHCLGVGGRDLGAAVGGRATLEALAALGEDAGTEVVVVVSKPPHPEVAERVRERASALGKPVVFALIGAGRDLTYAASEVVGASGSAVPDPWPRWVPSGFGSSVPAAGVVRGLFSGGTLRDEAAAVLGASTSAAAELTDFGDDEYTRGRAHPMLDHTLRVRALAAAAADPSTAVVLLDVVLGRGAHLDPAAELAPAVRAARDASRKASGRDLPVVVSLCGTSGDPQGLEKQALAFVDAGAAVYLSNAEAARAAGRLAVGA